MIQTKRYITESTEPNGEIVREERVVYVSKSGMEFDTAQAAYRDDIQCQLHDILGPAVDPVEPGHGGRYYAGDYEIYTSYFAGINKAINRMLDNPEPFIRLLETWNANRNS
jgi:hypothetical protein